MSKFEAVIMLSPDLSSENLKEQEESFNKLLIGLNGSVFSKEDWGLRDLSYNINNYWGCITLTRYKDGRYNI